MTASDLLRRVAVVDDNPDDRELIAWALEEVGLEPIIIDALDTVDDAVRQVRSVADAVVCDHQLRWGDYATFDGAELVARCFEGGFPAVLVTAYVMDTDASIRLYRRNIPGLIARDQLDGERLEAELTASRCELNDRPPPDRVPYPTLVRVLRIRPGTTEPMVDVVIPQWNPHRNVSFPARMLGALGQHPDQQLEGHRFIAQVNIGAEDESELYFEGFVEAPEVPDESELR